MPQLQLPPLSNGEIYIGAIGDQAGCVHHVILLPGDNDDASWEAQSDWAKSIGGSLPTRTELSLIWERCRDQMQQDWYWSCDAYEGGAGPTRGRFRFWSDRASPSPPAHLTPDCSALFYIAQRPDWRVIDLCVRLPRKRALGDRAVINGRCGASACEHDHGQQHHPAHPLQISHHLDPSPCPGLISDRLPRQTSCRHCDQQCRPKGLRGFQQTPPAPSRVAWPRPA